MKVKKESKKACLKLNIQKRKIVASVAITSWHIDGETMGSKISADGDYSHKVKRSLVCCSPWGCKDSEMTE